MTELIKELQEHYESLKDGRTDWDTLNQDVRDYLLPNRGWFTGQTANKGEKRKSSILDSRPQKYLGNTASLLQGGLASPASPWFKMGTPDPDLTEWGPVKEWLSLVERIMYHVFAKSNFYTTNHSNYLEMTGFGTAAALIEEDPKHFIRCIGMTFGSYCIATDGQHRVDTIYRIISLTAKQIVNRWPNGKGTAWKENIEQASEKSPYEYFDVLHAIRPRANRDASKLDRINMPWESAYWLDGNEEPLEVGGYQEFPAQVPRWDVCLPDVYGRGPGHDALPDAKQLMDVVKGITLAIHKQVDPPMLAHSSLKDRISLLPGKINYGNTEIENLLKTVYQVQPDYQGGIMLKADILEGLKETLYNDLFIFLMTQPNVTATQIVEQHEEKLLILGPMIERQQNELLEPAIDRTFGILDRLGVFPPPPPELEGMEMKVEYVSLLAQAQKLVGTAALDKTLAFGARCAMLNPDAIDKIDTDQMIDEFADLVGVRPRVIRPDEKVLEIRQAKQQAMQAEKQAMAMQQTADTAKTLSQAQLGENKNALTEIVGNA
jgi:hypothetical protein